MIRFLLRTFCLAAFAAAFVALVLDGTRSIAASTLAFTEIGSLIEVLQPGASARWRASVTQMHPLLWDPVLLHVLKTPAFLLFAALGLVLAWAARSPAPAIGYSSRA